MMDMRIFKGVIRMEVEVEVDMDIQVRRSPWISHIMTITLVDRLAVQMGRECFRLHSLELLLAHPY